MTTRNHGKWEEQLPAYAIGALDPGEAAEVDAHLETCDRCRAELRWLEPAVAVIPASVEQLEPPRRLRRRVLSAARADTLPAERGGTGARLRQLRPLVPAAAAMAIAAGLAGYALRGTDSEPTTVVVRAQSDAARAATATLTREGDIGALQVEGLPRLRGGDVYQAWVRDGSEIEPSATFVVDRDRRAAAPISGLEGADEVMVTREPRGGSDRPSTAPLLRALLDQS